MTEPNKKCRLVVLISGRGSNMQSIVETIKNKQLHAEVVAVIANKAEAKGIQWAQEQGIATQVLEHKQFADRSSFDARLAQIVQQYQPDYVLLAGFMRILTPEFVQQFTGRLINIHPSLLPLFPGLNTHQQAIDAELQWHGCTVHFVTPVLDHGPIIAQGIVPVHHDDDADTLAHRLLTIEHRVFNQVVEWLAQDRVQLLETGRVQVLDTSHRAFVA
ncbi:phosphoribosylglycinamide formyltransferase [Paenalcaligenes faecalis]|uniref:phosphoribosylglycinamide formyltransferase n=1 Tax=Paenalcaligenes faecalis TaxID=2980099 RepID=UPI0022B99FF1|nr:phosphoribosylglycinamide formyltransferase [Paenalcaligenes faecalis]